MTIPSTQRDKLIRDNFGTGLHWEIAFVIRVPIVGATADDGLGVVAFIPAARAFGKINAVCQLTLGLIAFLASHCLPCTQQSQQ